MHLFSKKDVLIFCIAGLFFLFTAYLSYNFSQSERFSDEVAHWVGGHYVLEGKELYKDLQFNHQPLNYYFSSAVEFIAQPSNLYLYVSRQRMAVFAYGILWNVLLIVLFGPFMLLFSFLFEIGKYWFSGYKLLAETLAAYPMVLITTVFIESFFFKKIQLKLKLILLSVSTFIAGFSLLPLWAVILPMNLCILLSQKKKMKTFLYQLIPFALLTGILFLFVNPYNLLKETYLYNTQYFLPVTEQFRPSFGEMLLFPFLVFTTPFSIAKTIIALLMILFLITGYISWKEKKSIKWIILFGLFILTNLLRVNESSFNSFHLLQWFGVLLISVITLCRYFYESIQEQTVSLVKGMCIVLVLLFIYSVVSQPSLWKKKDLANENYVNYSYSETYGRIVGILKEPGDNLIVVPNDPLIYWVANIDTGTRLLEFFPWLYPIPEYRNEIIDTFEENPPTYVVDTDINLSKDLEQIIYGYIQRDYIRLNYLGKPSRLYILKEKLPKIPDEKWNQLQEFSFTRP